MSLRSRAWIVVVAASVGAVETMKDQGFARWNYTMRSVQKHAKNKLRSYAQVKKLSAARSAATGDRAQRSR
ncbi:hypothetical protein QQ045_019248 [Rhodiola kirilowii]